jgi:hypothetical protein
MKKEKCDLTCPKCHELWGKLSFQYESKVSASDVKIVAGKKKKLKNGDDLKCNLCGHPYTNWDVMLAIAGGNDGQKKVL